MGRYSDTSISSATVGAISEMAVAIELMKTGWAVFRALSPSCECDLIARKNGSPIRIEVRTAYRNATGGVFFPSSQRDTPSRHDVIAAFVRNENKAYWFDNERKPIEDIEKLTEFIHACQDCNEIRGRTFRSEKVEEKFCKDCKEKA